MKRKALLLIIPFAAAGLAGCERANPNPPGPTPDPQCESATVNIKSAGDVTTIKPGQTLQLTAEVNISGCTFSWSSNDSTIATVDANGLVTGVKAGDVVINYGPGKFNLSIEENPPAPLREISIDDAIDLMDKAGDGKVVQEEVVVVGKVLSGSKKDSNGWNGTFEGNKLEFSSARTDGEYSSLDDCTIKVQCYLELYNGKYKIGYLPANVSPTGEKYNPKIISVQVPAGKEVKSVDSVKSAPASVAVGGTVAPSSVTLNVTLEDDTKSTVKATKVEVVTSVAAESVEGKAWYNELGPVTFNIKVVAEAPSSMKEAYEAAAALGKDGETEEFSFSGVVVGMRSATNEYYIQDGAYGIDIYGPSDKSLFAVGKKVNVTSTLQNYSGLIETKTIKEITAAGDGVLPEAAVVSSKGVLDSLKTNVLAEVTGSVVTVPTYTEGKDLTLKLNVNGDEIPVFFKGKLVSSYKDVIQSLAEGDEVVVKKAVTSAHGDMQLAVIDGTEVSKGQPTPQKEVDHIEITGSLEKSAYVEGEAYSAAGLSVVAYYTEGGSDKVSVTISPEHAKAVLGDTSIKFSATYDGKPAEKSFDVTVSPKPAPVAVDVSYRFEELVKKDSPAMTADEAKAAFVSGLVSGNDVVSAVTPNNTYAYDKAIRVGSKNGGGTLEITTSSIVTKAVISAHAYSAGELNNITIGSKTITVTAEETEYEFDLSESNKVSISTDKRVLIDGIGFCVKGATPVEPEVVSVAVTPKTADLPLNGTLQMSANVTVKGSASKEVNWYSSDESKATVSASGLVTPLAEGEVKITAKAKDNADKFDEATITVVPEAQDVLTKIEAKEYTNTVDYGETYEFDGKVYGTYSLSGEKELTEGWSVTTGINTEESGEQTGVITYAGVDPNITCEFKVTVSEPVEKADYTFTATAEKGYSDDDKSGATANVAGATGYEADRGVAWNKSAGTITISGLGSAAIKKIKLDVSHNKNTEPTVSVSIGGNPFGSAYTIAKENHASAVFTADPATGDVVISVDQTSDGSIWVKSIGIFLGSVEPVTPVSVTGVSLNKSSTSIAEGATETLVPTVAPSNATNKSVTWSSDDETVATVANGVITAVKEGSATITVTTVDGGFAATCDVTVTAKSAEKGTEDNPFTPAEAKVEALKLAETTDSKNPILSAEKYYIKGTVGEMAETFNPTYGNYSFWYEGKDFEVWRIKNGSSQAMFTGGEIQVGDEVTIYGSIMNFKGTAESATDAYVTNITRPVVAVTGVSFDPTEITIGVDGDATLSPVVAPANASNKSCNFEVVSGSDKVSLDGAKVTGVDVGDAVIKATTVDGGFEATITVHVSGETPTPVADPYECTFQKDTKASSYTGTSTQSLGNISWVLNGNASIDNYVKLSSGTANTTADRYICTQTAFSNPVTEFSLVTGAKDDAATVNSITLTVHSSADDAKSGTNAIESVTATWVADGTISFSKPSSSDWSGKYFRVTFNLSNTTKNKGIIVVGAKVEF